MKTVSWILSRVPTPDKPLTFKDVLQEVDELLEMLRRLDATTISGETMTVLAIEDQLSQVRGRLADLVVQRMFRTQSLPAKPGPH